MPDKYNKKAARGRKTDAPDMPPFEVRVLPPADYYNVSPALSTLLTASINAGTCFEDTSTSEAAVYWRRQAELYRSGEQLMVCAHRSGPDADEDEVIACVTLVLDRDTCGKHRAEFTKLLVADSVHEGPVAGLILAKAEHIAQQNERWLLYATVASGSYDESTFSSQGFEKAGFLPHFYQKPDKSGYVGLTQLSKVLRQPPTTPSPAANIPPPG